MKGIPDPDALSLEEKVGQMLCFGWRGDERAAASAQARECVRERKAGGMIVMGRNVPGAAPAAVRALLSELQSMADIPLLLPTDQEGGRVARLRAPFTPFPPARAIGRAGDTDLARLAAQVTGEELLQVGINWNFAPVADVNSNPRNPVIGDRSFGAAPDIVASMVRAQIAGYAQAGLLCCAKHFPGHGDTLLDSHYDLPAVAADLPAMEQRELVPFRAAIESGVDAIMTAHIMFPALDASCPATLSPALLTGLLREGLGFEGVIVTDCLEMKAVSDRWGTARAAVLAARAGADMLLVCHTPERQRAVYHALLAAARSGELPRSRLDEAAARVLAAKRKAADLPPLDIGRIGAPEHIAVARAIADKAGIAYEAPTAPTMLGAEAIP